MYFSQDHLQCTLARTTCTVQQPGPPVAWTTYSVRQPGPPAVYGSQDHLHCTTAWATYSVRHPSCRETGVCNLRGGHEEEEVLRWWSRCLVLLVAQPGSHLTHKPQPYTRARTYTHTHKLVQVNDPKAAGTVCSSRFFLDIQPALVVQLCCTHSATLGSWLSLGEMRPEFAVIKALSRAETLECMEIQNVKK